MKYKKEDKVSYTFGAFPTYELLSNKPTEATKVYIHTKLVHSSNIEKILELAQIHKIPVETNDKFIERVADKENIFIVGVFNKYAGKISKGNIVVLVNPSDMGNLGTTIRTMLGFNVCNLALISPHADIFNPKVVRASMGAVFSLNIESFASLDEFNLKHKDINKFLFVLNGSVSLQKIKIKKENYALIFGNEATGIDEKYCNLGENVLIEQSNKIDSFNLSNSIAIALYEFNKQVNN